MLVFCIGENMYKKTIILADNDKSNRGLATLVLEKSNKGNFATIKAYNLKNNGKDFVLGMNCNGKNFLKQNITFLNDTYMFRLPNNISLDSKIACVLSNRKNPILWGSTSNVVGEYKSKICDWIENDDKERVDNNIEDIKKELSQKIQSTNDSIKTAQLFESPKEDELDEQITKIVNTKNIAEIFNDETKSTENNTPFFDRIKDEVLDLFNKYPQDSELENIIPNSKWVKIDYENNGHYYVLGLIYEEGELKYLAYGIPQGTRGQMPDELIGYGRWIPLDAENVDAGGYYMVYQDVKTGKNIEL